MPARPILPAATSIAALVGSAPVGPANTPVAVASAADFTRVFGSGESPLGIAIAQFFANGGQQAWVVRVGDAVATDDDVSAPELEPRQRGLWALERVDPFNLLYIAPYAPGSEISARTRRAAAALCRARLAMFLADPMASWTSVDAVVGGMRSAEWGLPPDPNVAVYWPRVLVSSAAGDSMAWPPSAAVAGIIARTDAAVGVWKAPAGAAAAVAAVSGLTDHTTTAEEERLNRFGINVLRTFPGLGPLVWGARTLMRDDTLASEWKYLPVRRLGLFLESSLTRSTRWTSAEPNREPLWRDLRLAASAFLHDLFVSGAFQGRTDREAWFFKCDAATTTAADITAGRVRLVVGFAPLKPAEFIVLELTMSALPG